MSKKIFVSIIAILVLGIVGLVLVANKNGDTNQPDIKPSGTFQVDKKEFDLGKLSLQDKGIAEFTVTNPSDQPLTISKVGTSCMCTLAEVEIDGQKSPEFNMNMHNTAEMKKWQGTVAPGGKATVRITYIPKLMPVDGDITRSVEFTTSDPNNAEIELKAHAFVVK